MNEVKLEGYGLHKFYDAVSPASADVLENVSGGYYGLTKKVSEIISGEEKKM